MNKKEIISQIKTIKASDIKKGLCIFCVSLLIFCLGFYIKDNIIKRNEVEETIECLFENWNQQNLDNVYTISGEKEEFFITTGFEKNKEINNIINKHIYQGPEYSLKNIHIEGLGKKDAIATATIELKTYNNLELLDVIIKELLKDDTKVTMDYNHEDFVEKNLENIKEAVKKVKKNSKKLISIYLERKNEKWVIPFANNKEFYDSLSGNLITFNKEVDTEVEL